MPSFGGGIGAGPGAGATPKSNRGNGVTLPEPLSPDSIPKVDITLPKEPVGPFLITKNVGPFMVSAQSFKGPQSVGYAQALAMELRRVHHLPAYVWPNKMKPGNSNIRDVNPTADPEVQSGKMDLDAQIRASDEAMVLVGDCATVKEAKNLLGSVKKLKPDFLQQVPSLMPWRHKDLSRAFVTTNPLLPSEKLFPNRQDPLIKAMNSHPHSISKCNGNFTLQVAEFTGRSAYVQDGKFVNDDKLLKSSPLATAGDDAERLVDALLRDKEFRKLGVQPYVYHDRLGSKVTVGAFTARNDPNIAAVNNAMRDIVLRMNFEGVDAKTKERIKQDVEVKKTGLMRPLTDLIKSKVTSTPILYRPDIIPVPRSS